MVENGLESLPFEPPDEEAKRLREENARLRRLLAAHSIPIPQLAPKERPALKSAKPMVPLNKEERGRQRIALFRSLFRGREDMYARRWENEDGRSGYVPAAMKDWKSINQSRPEDRKKVDRKTRKFFPMTDAVVQNHLLGRETVGVYPLLPDETCWFLAVDFDKKTWEYDSLAFLETCRELGVPAALERSRSGKGGHVWIFFERALPATTARKLGCVILTRTMERRHQVGLDSYDRFFPNQDTMPKGGFGNLIALPLQYTPRKVGNSVFIDSDFRPYPDQWQFLSAIQRMMVAAAEEIVIEAQRKGDLIGVRISSSDHDDGEQDPWSLPPSRKRRERPVEGPLPSSVQIIRANLVYVEKKELPPAMLNRLLRLAAFQNPEFYKAQTMRLPTHDKPRVIACGQEFLHHVAVPRGCLAEVLALLEAHKIRPQVRDERFAGHSIEVAFQGQLRPFQQEAVDKISNHDEGILCAPTAFGKTAVAASLIAKRKINTLVLVHRQQLLDQWQERLAMFLDLSAKSIGHIGGGKADRTGYVDVAVIQSLYQKEEVKDLVAEYGQVIVDECHHISAFTFEQVMRQVKAKYIVGLTATPTRKDGHHPIIYMQCGPIRFSMSARTMTETAPFEHRVIPRHTEFRMPSELTDITIQGIYAAMLNDALRNELIVADIARAIESGRCPLLLTLRTEHLQYLAAKLASVAKHVFVLKGGMGKKQRRSVAEELASVPENESRVILATGSYIGEGFDDARLDTLFLAMPISWKGTLQQYVGRLHRLHDSKKVVQVYDYVDNYVPMLARMYDPEVLEYYDQALSIRLAYESANERHLSVMHTPDYFVIHKDSAGWQECKQERELERLAQKSPRRYCRDEGGKWRCPPGEAFAAPFGLYYRLRSSAEIDWTLQRNIQYLEDYWRFDDSGVASEIREIVQGEIAAAPGLHLSGLLRNVHGLVSRDDINRLIAAGDIYVDLRADGVMEPDKVRVFPNRAAALACQHIEDHPGYRDYPRFIQLALGSCVILDGKVSSIVDFGKGTIKLHATDSTSTELPIETFEAFVREGQVEPTGVRLPEMKISGALGAASEYDLKIANQRFELVHRHLNRQLGPDQISVPKRTLRLWVARYKQAETQCGSGYVGLIPKTRQRGNRGSKLPAESRALLNDHVEQNYETLKQKSKFSVWAALLNSCQEKGVVAPSYATFCSATRRRPAFESILKRQGRRAAYPHEPFYWELERSTPRHGDRPFEIGHIDHTELDVELVCSHTGRVLGRPWMTLFTDAFSRRCLALCLAFDAPSYRSCMMIFRDCVRRHGRLPQIVVVDGGPEFQSTYFEALLARYECIKKTRPPAKARFGACCERLFGTTNTRFIHNLQGNTQITRNIRQVTKSVDPRELAVWTLAELHRRISEFLFEVYDTVDHPALGESPREAFRTGIEASGVRAERMISYDQEFLISTLPTTARGTAKVLPGRGVIINHIYYWSSCFQVPGVENQQVPIRYDPFDAGTAYAFVERRWVRCHSEYYATLNGHSEKELMIASNELRKRQ